jgi:hypothetical protein
MISPRLKELLLACAFAKHCHGSRMYGIFLVNSYRHNPDTKEPGAYGSFDLYYSGD